LIVFDYGTKLQHISGSMGGMLLIDMFLTEVLYLDLKIKEYLLFQEY